VIQLHAHDDQAVINNVKIFNNTITDMPRFPAMRIIIDNSHADWMSGWEIKNNIVYNCGYLTLEPAISFEDQVSPRYTCPPDFLDYNNINGGPEGNSMIRCAGTNYLQAHGQSAAPLFVSYNEFSQDNDLRLLAEDSAAKDNGVSLAAYFTSDKDGTSRPQGSGWDMGAYELIKDVTPPSPPIGLTVY